MKLSLNWIKQYTDVDLPVEDLVRVIGAQLGEVDGIENIAPKYDGAVIVRVVTCDDHPNADRLHVVTIDDGGITPDVNRGEDGYVQVVCGAPNVHADMLAVWLPPGATVPDSYDTDPFVLEARELRGVVSNGMLASPRELALGESHDGILEIDPTEWSPRSDEIKPGAKFGCVFGLDDTIIDIENKMFTHRPDLFGQLGLAREVAGITGKAFHSPEWYTSEPEFTESDERSLEVSNEAPELVPRFMTAILKDVVVKPSPLWLQCELVRVGAKPINNVVDVTNYIMLLTAQPTHAYDYDKLSGGKLMARLARPDEKVTLLNHKTYELDPNDIVIADGEGPVGLAGVMGGGDSEVSEATTTVVLECATFDMYAVRRSSMRHGIFTDALTRFNKGQSPLQNDHVLQLLIKSIHDVAGGAVAGQVQDINHLEGRVWVHPPVPVTTAFINARLGLHLSAEEMKTLLENVECHVDVEDDNLTVTAPFWRTDIETREDVVEEVGRLYGFDKLPLELPERSVAPVAKDALYELKAAIRETLVSTGANELLTYSFVHGNLLEKVGQNRADAFRLSNALSPDLQYYRLSITPSLLDKVHPNIKAGYDTFSLFEMGKTHATSHTAHDDGELPGETDVLAAVYASKVDSETGAAYYTAKAQLDQLAASLGVELEYTACTQTDEPYQKPFDPSRSALVRIKGGELLGIVGEYTAGTRRNLKLPVRVAGYEVAIQPLLDARSGSHYQALSKFPSVTQDMTLRISADVTYGQLEACVLEALDAANREETFQLEPLSVYQATDASTRNISFRIHVTSYVKTLRDEEVSGLLDTVVARCAEMLGAERV